LKHKDQWSWKPWRSFVWKRMCFLLRKNEFSTLLPRIITSINNSKLPWQEDLST
jgi:hypothetical protein